MKNILFSACGVLAFSLVSSLALEAAPAKEAVEAKPEVLIQDLYKAEYGVFTPGENKELSAKFLASTLIELLELDAKNAAGEMGAIDFDVLSYSQDESQITKFDTQSEVNGDKAVVKTSFENHGEGIVINFHCVKEAGQWRIADVTYEDGTSLVKLLTATE